jgi:hypothetical protein
VNDKVRTSMRRRAAAELGRYMLRKPRRMHFASLV